MNIRCEGQQAGKVINSGMGLHLQIMHGFRISRLDTLIHRQNILGDPFIEIIKSNITAETVYLNNVKVFINASIDFKLLDSISKKVILNQLNNTLKFLDSIPGKGQ